MHSAIAVGNMLYIDGGEVKFESDRSIDGNGPSALRFTLQR